MTDKLRAVALMAVDALDSDDPTIQLRAAISLRAALAEPDEQKPVAHPFKDASVIAALSWAADLIKQEYPVGHNGADSWLMNYSDKHGEHIRRSDHRDWEKVQGRWTSKAALLEPAIKDSLTVAEPVAWMSDRDVGFYEEEFGTYPCVPLYTAPPRREWVGLTNDEVNSFAAGCHLGNSVQVAIYKAEAKLREKNT